MSNRYCPLGVQAKALLGAAEGVFLAGISIKLFAGLRTSELLQLDWNEVGDRQIIVLARHAKTRRRRVISISENLRKWIGPFRKELSGPVIPHTARRWHDRVGAIATLARRMCSDTAFAHIISRIGKTKTSPRSKREILRR